MSRDGAGRPSTKDRPDTRETTASRQAAAPHVDDMRLDPEAALVGAVLNLPAATAANVLAGVCHDDFADPRLAVVAGVCRELAEAGVAPDPVTVLAHIRRHAVVGGIEAARAAALLIADLYAAVPLPASWPHYRQAVLEEAFRRRVAQMVDRLAQAASGESIESLAALIDREVAAVREAARRLDAQEAS